MTLVREYRAAQEDEVVARLRRVLALRAMVASGMKQREIGAALGISQPAVSQQLKALDLGDAVHAETLLTAAAPVLKVLATERGFERLAVFGSVARGEAHDVSDVDLLVDAPSGTSSLAFVRFQELLAQVLGRDVDLVDYGGLTPGLDDDVSSEAVLL